MLFLPILALSTTQNLVQAEPLILSNSWIQSSDSIAQPFKTGDPIEAERFEGVYSIMTNPIVSQNPQQSHFPKMDRMTILYLGETRGWTVSFSSQKEGAAYLFQNVFFVSDPSKPSSFHGSSKKARALSESPASFRIQVDPHSRAAFGWILDSESSGSLFFSGSVETSVYDLAMNAKNTKIERKLTSGEFSGKLQLKEQEPISVRLILQNFANQSGSALIVEETAQGVPLKIRLDQKIITALPKTLTWISQADSEMPFALFLTLENEMLSGYLISVSLGVVSPVSFQYEKPLDAPLYP